MSWTAEWVTEFVTAVHERREPEVSFREGWENLAFIESAYQSLDTGAPIAIPEFPERS